MDSSLRSLFFALSLVFLLPNPASAEPYGSPFQVNQLTHTSGGVMWLRSATGANGDTALLWRGGTGGSGNFLARFDAAGRPLQSQELNMGTAAVGVAVSGTGNYALLSQSSDGSGSGVFVTVYNRAGTVIVPQFQVNSASAGEQVPSAIAMNANGQFVVAWTTPSPSTGFPAIAVKRFQANGAAVAAETVIHSNVSSNDRLGNIDIGMDAAGNFVVSWDYGDIRALEWQDVYARRFNASGAPLGATFRVNTYINGGQNANQIAMSDAGAFVIVWNGPLPDATGWGVFGQRYDAAGVPQGSEFRINTQAANNVAEGLDIAPTPNGGFVVAWHHDRPPNGSVLPQIVARSYGPTGLPLEQEFAVSQATNDWPIAARVGVDRNGNFVVSWFQQNYSATIPFRVVARRYTPSGVVIQPLANGQAVPNLAGPTGSWRYFKLTVPAGQNTIDASIFGGTGDADLYMRWGALPALNAWDIRPFLAGNNESVRLLNFPPGDWYIGIQGFNAYSGLTLQATSF